MVHPALENYKSNDTQIIVNFADFIDCLGSQEEKEQSTPISQSIFNLYPQSQTAH